MSYFVLGGACLIVGYFIGLIAATVVFVKTSRDYFSAMEMLDKQRQQDLIEEAERVMNDA